MEDRRFSNSHEDDEDEDDDELDTPAPPKRRRPLEALLQRAADEEKETDSDKKEQVGLDIGKSLFEKIEDKPKSTDAEDLSEESNADVQPEAVADTIAEVQEGEIPIELTSEEEIYVNRSIANRHLEEPVTTEPPTPNVTEFLEMVVDGLTPNEAYETTIRENQLGGEALPAAETDVALPPVVRQVEESQPDLTAQVHSQSQMTNRPLTASNPGTAPSKAPKPSSPATVLEKPSTYSVAAASEMAGYLYGKRHAKRQAKKEAAAQKQQFEAKVQKMEIQLSGQELTIQRLTQENKIRQRNIQPIERATPATQESRLMLSKPERVERIGKVVIAAEKPKSITKERVLRPNNLKEYFRPEDVKTMRREDLMIVSEKIRVDGANLKDMYKNNLFSEKALRRLVREYLKGNDIRPLLRREIVEKEIDFERDPIFRDIDRIGDNNKSETVFDRILNSVDLTSTSSKGATTEAGNKSSVDKKTKSAKAQDMAKKALAPASNNAANVALITTIAVLLALIIFLLVRHS